MTTTPLPPAIEPVAWFEYARKKPTLKRLVFDRTSRSQLRVAGWVSEPLVKESDATQARADLEAKLSAHKAARIAYASEFPLNSEGEPDVGSIHQNIRALKAENQRLRESLETIYEAVGIYTLADASDCAAAALKDTK